MTAIPAISDYCQLMTRGVMETPFHKMVGLEILEQGRGQARIRIRNGDQTRNLAGVMHGGIIYALLDVACYLALLTELKDGYNAVTHDIHVSVMRPVAEGDFLVLEGGVTRLGRSLAFCSGEARCGEKLVATARVTKSIVPFDPAGLLV